jgi:hypothetical protein
MTAPSAIAIITLHTLREKAISLTYILLGVPGKNFNGKKKRNKPFEKANERSS